MILSLIYRPWRSYLDGGKAEQFQTEIFLLIWLANCPDICEQAASQLWVKCLQDKRRVMEVILVANCYRQFLIDQVSELYVRTDRHYL